MADPAPPQPWWRQVVSQYLVPTAVAGIVASAISVYSAVNAQREKERAFNEAFENLVTGQGVMSAFQGNDAQEQRAAETLLALQAVADTSAQKTTVLLTGARLLNANTSNEGSGGPAARLLTILIDQDERSGDLGVRTLTRSQPFLDLVTAGYSNDYYNEDLKRDWYTWPTLNGDQPITHDAKLLLLRELTPAGFDGWVHVATFSTTYSFPNVPPVNAPPTPLPTAAAVQLERVPQALSSGDARSFLDDLNRVILRRDMGQAKAILAQYAESPPNEKATPVAPASGSGAAPQEVPLFGPATLMKASDVPADLLMLKPRLLRTRPPVEYVNPDGSFHKGSLGTIVGAISAGTCVKVVEPLQPVLVFVTKPLSDHVPGAPKNDWVGLIHMWAHVQPSSGCALNH